MKTTNCIIRGLCLLFVITQAGCQSTQPTSNNSPGQTVSMDSSMKTLTIRALIDGADTVKVQGHKIWYEHESFDLPGRWQGRDEPTFINGKQWHPVWDGEKCTPFEGLTPAFKPQSPADTSLTIITARGDVKISQMPAPDNNETLAIHFDDEQILGAAWYK